MDACARIRGIPLKNRASIRKEIVRESSAVCAKSLLKNRKELSSVLLELQPTRDLHYLAELHFVSLPSYAEGEDFTLQTHPSCPSDLVELLRSLHVHSLKNEEMLLLKDSKKLLERKDSISQTSSSKAMCILRQSHIPQISVSTILGLLTRYVAGIRYALELQSLQRGVSEACQAEDDDTNQSVSSIEEDFVTAFEHLEEEETGDCKSYSQRNQRDVASQTVPLHRKDLSSSRIIVSTYPRKSASKQKPSPNVSVSVQRSSAWSSDAESQWSTYKPGGAPTSPKGRVTANSLTESEESDCSSPSPIIFLDEVGYQKSLKAKLDIPKIPILKDGVEDSDSEVSEFFDSFDQFDDLDQTPEAAIKAPKDKSLTGQTLKKKLSEDSGSKYVSRGSSTLSMNPHKFDQPILPANIKKPTPLKPGSPYGGQSDVPDSPRPVRTSCEESGGLFSPVRSSAFSPLADGGALEYFWKPDGDSSELRKPHDLCSLYKTYSDFANNLSKQILGSVCGYSSPVDMNLNKNLSCVCHKEFTNTSGHLMKLADIQGTVTIAKTQHKSQSFKDGLQRFATDLVEMSIVSALRDLQKGVSSCTTTLCHLAARLTSSVFQMAFHEIGMQHAYVLKERAINGLANFLVGEAVSGALKEFLFVKKQIFNNTVARFAADLAEELVFEGIMEVCQFSHPSTPLTQTSWSFEQEEEVFSSYASDLSESVLQEAFIELSQAEVTFTTQAAISVSLDNICYVSSDNKSQTTKTCNASGNYMGLQIAGEDCDQVQDGCTVKKALFCVSGMASCVPVPVAGKAISHLQTSEETCRCKTSISHTFQTSPRRSMCTDGTSVLTSGTPAATQTDSQQVACGASDPGQRDQFSMDPPSGRTHFHNISSNMVDMIMGEAIDLVNASKVKKKVEDCADFLSKTIGGRLPASQEMASETQSKSPNATQQSTDSSDSVVAHKYFPSINKANFPDTNSIFPISAGPKTQRRVTYDQSRTQNPSSTAVTDVHSVTTKDTLEVPTFEVASRIGRKVVPEETTNNSSRKFTATPSTPPSTPQQASEVSSEKQIKQFSKKLKGKLAKEFSPATPPPTPHNQPVSGETEKGSDSEKEDFMLKLMRSLSEEADSDEDVDEDQEDSQSQTEREGCQSEDKMTEKGALLYAERLACHIVSMATEMDVLSCDVDGRKKLNGRDTKDVISVHSTKFSEQTLNSLWMYAGEIAGEVISDVKKIMISSRCRHKATKRGDDKDSRLSNLADQWSSHVLTTVLNPRSSSSAGLSSEYPSCESVTDEFAGYLIKVLKREGGNRELILDQYAGQLAYRSIKSGLVHASRKVKQKSPLRLYSSRHLHHDGTRGICRVSASQTCPSMHSGGKETPADVPPCPCDDCENVSKKQHIELVNFAESLAFNITCDVTRKLRASTVRLPKSLTDSCLYKKCKVEDMAENLVKSSFSCSVLPITEKSRQYHSTSSLNDGSYDSGVMHVIEHYAKKIVDDTLEMTLGSDGTQTAGHRSSERNSYAEKLAHKACCYCGVGECPFCGKSGLHRFQGLQKRKKQQPDPSTGLDIPWIQIDLDKRAVFVEEMASTAIEKAKKELSSTSLNADSGIGHDGASFAESLTTDIMTSALSNVGQPIGLSSPGKDGAAVAESPISQQLSLSVGEDCLGSWSNLSFEDDHPDESSSFLHLSDSSNGNSSSWSSLGLEGDVYDEHLSFSPSDSDCTEEKEPEAKEESCVAGLVRVDRAQVHAERVLLVLNTDLKEPALDPQLRTVLQWLAASIAELPVILLGPHSNRELQQLPAIVQRVREREWRVGDLLQVLLRYCEEVQTEEQELGARRRSHKSLFQWLLDHI
ncbi:A-kinase anchor protein 11 isoform X3 [Denticeps clupeoides]|uniref:A-kinase anchor protein 11 isoform X3 n=1 Tax=Denticeps clupeoides TaxID=299321 RepID=UPI0010A2D565|nr:A-kinase anchor protein 11 isoform X3 [Denticeps clupeoides]